MSSNGSPLSPIWVRPQRGTVVKAVDAVTTTLANVSAAIWTPATGKKFILSGFQLSAVVTTVLAGATPGGGIWLVDSTFANGKIAIIGVVRTVTDAAGTVLNDGTKAVDIAEYMSTAANNAVKIVASATIGTGIVTVSGIVWGHEIP